MAIYLDCNATAPMEPQVAELVLHYMKEEYGNAGSRTHELGTRAKKAVEKARAQVAEVVKAGSHEVVFTSGATESNNIALLGLAEFGEQKGKKHIISSVIEHKAVLEPLEFLAQKGFEIELVKSNLAGVIDPKQVRGMLREDTLLLSLMHVNNETGVIQPIEEVAELLEGSSAYFHVDAAQGFGKEIDALQMARIDLISLSGHKIYGPKGIGALIARRRGYTKPPLQPLLYGGGQERGLRPGTHAVPLISGLGLAAELALRNYKKRRDLNKAFKRKMLSGLASLHPHLHGDQSRCVAHTANLSFPGLDSEAVILQLKNEIILSNGSACTSQSYDHSHVMQAMALGEDEIESALRFSWCHLTELAGFRIE